MLVFFEHFKNDIALENNAGITGQINSNLSILGD